MTFSNEAYCQTLVDEITPLIQAHYAEVAHYKDIPLDPDWAVYENAYRNGMLKIFTARDHSRLVGYIIFFVRLNPHYRGSLQAAQDVLFLSPEMRQGFAGARFIKWCDKQLKERGVQAVYHHSKCSQDFGKILTRMGYEAIDIIYAKRLDQWERD